MAFIIDNFLTIRNRILADIDASMAADSTVRGPTEYAIATAQAFAILLLQTAISRAARNNVPSVAEPRIMRLWAAFFGVIPKSASQNVGQATFAATTGATLPAGTSVRLRNGVEFTVDADVTESGDGTVTAALTAVLYGPAGRAVAGTPIFLGSPVAGITTEGVVDTGGISLGQNSESDASVLARLLERLRDPPKGGTDADFRRWVRATPGVAADRVWIYNSTRKPEWGPSSVITLFSVVPISESGYDPVPTVGEVEAVQAYVQPFAPIDVLAYKALAVGSEPLDPQIQLEDDTSDKRSAVTAALRELLRARQAPGGTIRISDLNEAIAGAIGDDDHVLVYPTGNVTAVDDEAIIVLGTPVFGAIA